MDFRPSLFVHGRNMEWCEKVSGSILSSIYSQTLAVSPAINDLMDLCPNIWCKNSKAIFFLDSNFFVFEICFIYPQNACFLCALCGKVTTFLSLSPKYTVQNTLWNKQVCPKLINVIMENYLLHRSGDKITLWNVTIKVSPLLSHIFIHTCTFCFAMTWCTSATSICLFVSSNKPGIKS